MRPGHGKQPKKATKAKYAGNTVFDLVYLVTAKGANSTTRVTMTSATEYDEWRAAILEQLGVAEHKRPNRRLGFKMSNALKGANPTAINGEDDYKALRAQLIKNAESMRQNSRIIQRQGEIFDMKVCRFNPGLGPRLCFRV